MAQGKAYDKKKIIEVLKPYFLLGYSVNKACEVAGIPQSTVQTWIDKDEELRLKIRGWINYVSSKSREVVAKSVTENENKEDAKWWLERREKKDFSTRTENETELKVEGKLNIDIDGIIDKHDLISRTKQRRKVKPNKVESSE